MRERTLSARLVRMMGTRAPSTIAGAVGVGQKAELLREDVAGVEVRGEQDVRIASVVGHPGPWSRRPGG
jgi:hypothetical protein